MEDGWQMKGQLGFGCMRLPMKEDQVDEGEFKRMVDAFLTAGFNYFDTAHGYLNGKSEIAIRECLVKRYPRCSYLLTDKLTETYFNRQEDIRPFFESQLKACGVEYFDFYLMHAQNARNFEKFISCQAYETALELKNEGKIRHLGISFHDTADVLEKILKTYPQIEVVQIQFNYVDFEDPIVQSRACYEVCRKYEKAVIVMEPVKGGTLVDLPQEALALLKLQNNGSPASYAIRFAASFDGVCMVLSGMSNLEQLLDNVSYMQQFKDFTIEEHFLIEQINRILKSLDSISCTSCGYCVEGCPKRIAIPRLFSDMNQKRRHPHWNYKQAYAMHTSNGGKASDCIGCGKCELACPQHLKIREHLKWIVEEFES